MINEVNGAFYYQLTAPQSLARVPDDRFNKAGGPDSGTLVVETVA